MRHRRALKVRRAANAARARQDAATGDVLTWVDLTAMDTDELRAVAERMGIAPEATRLKTASAINRKLKAGRS